MYPKTSRTENLPRQFIDDVLNKIDLNSDQFQFVAYEPDMEYGPVRSTSDLQIVTITASPSGWAHYEKLKKEYLAG